MIRNFWRRRWCKRFTVRRGPRLRVVEVLEKDPEWLWDAQELGREAHVGVSRIYVVIAQLVRRGVLESQPHLDENRRRMFKATSLDEVRRERLILVVRSALPRKSRQDFDEVTRGMDFADVLGGSFTYLRWAGIDADDLLRREQLLE